MKLIRPAKKDFHIPFRPEGHPEGRHSGLDYGWGEGDDVLAAAYGKVISVYGAGGYNGGWGNRIVIEHFPGVRTTYNHLATGTILVKAGDTVKAGDLLARMGETGRVSGKHLHFELYIGSERVDPAPYFTKDLPGSGEPADGGTDGPFVDLPSWWYSYSNASDAINGRYQRGVGIGPGRFRVKGSDRGAILVEANRGNVWLHPKAGEYVTGKPKAKRYVRLNTPWFYYPNPAAARAARQGHRGPTLPKGDYLLTNQSQPRGPYGVKFGNLVVYVGTGRTDPPVISK